MDGDGRLRKQHEPSAYQAPGAMGTNPGQQASGSTGDRYRQPPLLSSRSETAQAVGRSGGMAGYGEYGYTEQHPSYSAPSIQAGNLPGGAMQYQADFSPDPSRQQASQQQPSQHQQQSQQQYPQYGAGMVYNLGQQATPQSPYEAVPQYQQRQSAAIEVLSTQFGVPQYFAPSEPASAGVPAVHSQYLTSQVEPSSYTQQSPVGRSLPQSYPAAMADFNPMAAQETLDPQEGGQDSASYDDAYNQYQQALKQTFENVRTGRLPEAGESLLEISGWLLGHAEELGLVRDEEELHSDRMKLWDEFNTCWLAVLQKQKDTTQEFLDAGQQPQNIIPLAFLRKMGDELVRLCDRMEQHGLVDYEMGVWEEEILGILTQCVDLLVGDADTADSGSRAGPSSARS